jgi:hypothetical protein
VVRGFDAAFREGKTPNQAIEESTNYVLMLWKAKDPELYAPGLRDQPALSSANAGP